MYGDVWRREGIEWRNGMEIAVVGWMKRDWGREGCGLLREKWDVCGDGRTIEI